MVFDDDMYMRTNPLFKDPQSFSYPFRFKEFVNYPAKIGIDPDLATNFITRPLAYAGFYLNYRLDGFNPRWFRVANIVIHLLNSILVFALVRRLMARSENSTVQGSSIFIPATSAFLFAAHPLATESVTYIVQRFTSQSTLFYLLTIWLHMRSLDATSRRGLFAWRAASVVAVLGGMLTKECVFTAPLMAVLLDRWVHDTPWRKAVKRGMPLLLCMPLIPALVIATSMARHSGNFDLTAALNIVNSLDHPLDHWHYVITQVTVIVSYLRRIIWPTGLNIDPEWPLYTKLLAAPVLTSLAILSALIAIVWWMKRKWPADARHKLAWSFTIWFFVTLVTSSAIVPLPDLMADHRTYLPSVGIFILTACVLDRFRTMSLPRASVMRFAVPFASIIAVAALAWSTTRRNVVWSSAVNLWSDTTSKSPNKYRTWGNLGAALSTAGKEEEAVKCYHKALTLEPHFRHAIFNLSNSLLRLGRHQESLDTSIKLVHMSKNSAVEPEVALTVGLGLTGSGKHHEAYDVLNKVVAAMPNDPRSHRAIGGVYIHLNQPARALEHFRQAASLMQTPDKALRDAIKLAETLQASTAPPLIINPNFRLR